MITKLMRHFPIFNPKENGKNRESKTETGLGKVTGV